MHGSSRKRTNTEAGITILSQDERVLAHPGSFQYRVQQEGDVFRCVPSSGRDRTCYVIKIEPLLDQPILLRTENMLLTDNQGSHYRFYWLAREQSIRGGWTINLRH